MKYNLPIIPKTKEFSKNKVRELFYKGLDPLNYTKSELVDIFKKLGLFKTELDTSNMILQSNLSKCNYN